MKRLRKRSAAAVLTVAGLAASGILWASGVMAGDAEQKAPPIISNLGQPVEVTASMQAVLVQAEATGGTLRLFGRIEGKSFYKLEGSERGTCYGFGLEAGAKATLNALVCGLAALDEPLVDLSVVEENLETGVARFDQVQGWAADEVASIAVLDADGATLAKTTVTDNIYAIAGDVLAGTTGVRLVAYDAAGNTVHEIDA